MSCVSGPGRTLWCIIISAACPRFNLLPASERSNCYLILHGIWRGVQSMVGLFVVWLFICPGREKIKDTSKLCGECGGIGNYSVPKFNWISNMIHLSFLWQSTVFKGLGVIIWGVEHRGRESAVAHCECWVRQLSDCHGHLDSQNWRLGGWQIWVDS